MIKMPRRPRKPRVDDIYKALFERTSSTARVNKLIDAFFESDEITDTLMHFINEAVVHGKPDLFMKNFKKYTLKPKAKKLLKKELGI